MPILTPLDAPPLPSHLDRPPSTLPLHPSLPSKSLSFFYSFVFIINQIYGPGVLALPILSTQPRTHTADSTHRTPYRSDTPDHTPHSTRYVAYSTQLTHAPFLPFEHCLLNSAQPQPLSGTLLTSARPCVCVWARLCASLCCVTLQVPAEWRGVYAAGDVRVHGGVVAVVDAAESVAGADPGQRPL